MRRLLLLGASATIAAVPAVFGLAGNPSFSQSVPVQTPVQAKAVVTATPTTHDKADDRGKHVEPGDDRGTDAPRAVATTPARAVAPSPVSIATVTATAGADDKGIHVEPGDDKGVHVEAGDDKGTQVEPGDDKTAVTSTATTSTGNSSGKGRGGHDDAPGHQ
jgi:hypothetical protein